MRSNSFFLLEIQSLFSAPRFISMLCFKVNCIKVYDMHRRQKDAFAQALLRISRKMTIYVEKLRDPYLSRIQLHTSFHHIDRRQCTVGDGAADSTSRSSLDVVHKVKDLCFWRSSHHFRVAVGVGHGAGCGLLLTICAFNADRGFGEGMGRTNESFFRGRGNLVPVRPKVPKAALCFSFFLRTV